MNKTRLQERLHFLKRDVCFGLVILLLTFILCFFPPISSALSLRIFLWAAPIFLITQIIGFWRLPWGYLGKSFIVFVMTACLIGTFVLKANVSLNSPFKEGLFLLYSGTNAWMCFRVIQSALKSFNTIETRLIGRDIDYAKKIIYLPFALNEKADVQLSPKKHKLSIWLTAMTQVFLLKMNWHSDLGTILTLVSSSLCGTVCLFASTCLFLEFSEIIAIEKELKMHLSPALRQAFSLKEAIIAGQSNS